MSKTIVGQAAAKEARAGASSSTSEADDAAIELADVVSAIQRASADEINTINLGFDQLKSVLVNSLKKASGKAQATKPQNKGVINDKNPQQLGEKSASKISEQNGAGSIPPKVAVKVEDLSAKEAKNKRVVMAGGGEPVGAAMPKSGAVTPEAPRKKRQLNAVEVAPDVAKAKVNLNAGQKDSPIIAPDNTVNNSKNLSKKSPIIDDSIISKYKLDPSGRLRNERGAYASKAEQKQHKKATNGDPASGGLQPQEDAKQTSLLKQLVFSSAKLATLGLGHGVGRNGLGDKDGAIKNTAGMAVGGSYFLAAQEVAGVIGDIKDSLKDSGIESFGDAMNKVKEKAKAATGSVTGFGGKMAKVAKAVQMRVTGKDDVLPPASKKPSSAKSLLALKPSKSVTAKGGVLPSEPKKPSLIKSLLGKASALKSSMFDRVNVKDLPDNAKSPPTNVKDLPDNVKNPQTNVKDLPDNVKNPLINVKNLPDDVKNSQANVINDGSAAPKWFKAAGNPLFKFFKRLKPSASSVDNEMLKAYGVESKEVEQRHQSIVVALGDIDDSIKGISLNGGGGSGLLGDALDGLGDRKRRKKGRRGRRTSRFDKPSGLSLSDKSERVTKGMSRGSSYGASGRPAASIANSGRALGGTVAGNATKAGGMAGGAIKAGGMAGGALKAGGAVLSKLALPLTIAMAAYDGIQGYNDSEGQAEAFNLKEGQEASTGQKASYAAGSVLSLGGLTELIGISGSDISKSIYSLFGGDSDSQDVSEVDKDKPAKADETKPTKEAATSVDAEAIVSPVNPMPVIGGGASSQVASSRKQTEDIESIESLNKLQQSASANKGKTKSDANAQLISKSDPEIVKLLKSIDKKMEQPKSPSSFKYGGNHRPSSATGVPKDFSNADHRQQSNNLG